MKNAEIVQSEASDKKYVVIRARLKKINSTDFIKIQAEGPEVNRPYGVSDIFDATEAPFLYQFLESEENPEFTSLAGTYIPYHRITARLKVDEIKIQGIGKEVNRHYGVSDAFSDKLAPKLADFLAKCLNKEQSFS